jgi:hypothetical protein
MLQTTQCAVLCKLEDSGIVVANIDSRLASFHNLLGIDLLLQPPRSPGRELLDLLCELVVSLELLKRESLVAPRSRALFGATVSEICLYRISRERMTAGTFICVRISF